MVKIEVTNQGTSPIYVNRCPAFNTTYSKKLARDFVGEKVWNPGQFRDKQLLRPVITLLLIENKDPHPMHFEGGKLPPDLEIKPGESKIIELHIPKSYRIYFEVNAVRAMVFSLMDFEGDHLFPTSLIKNSDGSRWVVDEK